MRRRSWTRPLGDRDGASRRTIVDRRERETRLHAIGGEPRAAGLELLDRARLDEPPLPLERGDGRIAQRVDSRHELVDPVRHLGELLGPRVARGRHAVMTRLRLLQLEIEPARARLQLPQARLVIALEIPQQQPPEEAMLAPEL